MKHFSLVFLVILASCATPVKTVATPKPAVVATPEPKSWITVRNHFFTVTGARINSIDVDLQKMENNPAQGNVARANLANQSMVATRDLLEEVRTNFAKLRKVEEKDWSLKKEDFVASMNDLEAKYELVKKYYSEI